MKLNFDSKTMKRLNWLFLFILSVSAVVAQTDEKKVKLLGIVDGLGMKLAVLEVQAAGSPSPSEFF